MGIAALDFAPLHCVPQRPLLPRRARIRSQSSLVSCRLLPRISRVSSDQRRSSLLITNGSFGRRDVTVRASEFDMEISDFEQAKIALAEARGRLEALEKERDHLMKELAKSEAMLKDYASGKKQDKDLVVSDLNEKLEQMVQERSVLESKLALAKQEAVNLAVQVEKLAELTLKQATSHIMADAKLRIATAEASAAEKTVRIEEQIRKEIEGTISSIVEQSTETINKALSAAEVAAEHAKKTMGEMLEGVNSEDEFEALRNKNIKLENRIDEVECQLLIQKSEVDRLKSELAQALAQAKASDLRGTTAARTLAELQEATRKRSSQKDEVFNDLLAKTKKEADAREKATAAALRNEMKAIMGAVEAAKATTLVTNEANIRRCNALQRSLHASDAALEFWRRKAEIAESILHGERSPEEEVGYVMNGGRISLQTDDESLKWKLLTEGPRRKIPEWMARRISSFLPKFPPRKIDISKALSTDSLILDLPKPGEVWSIAQEKPRDIDTLVDHVIERDVIEKKRKALERALERKTGKLDKVPEQPKLEPGTGTGREIVFQGFNWESWRRQWYLEMAPKAADLSHSGITSVWLPPPTESVAPQGYMPSDLYNLNSAYGTVEELKQCIQEMHAHDLLALGDVVLNHRCAQKQSPNGVWNIYGGKLAWGPEAIVCDDPNFQGRGNPSTGDIFHAAPNIDHSQEFVRKDIKEWLLWLRQEIGFDGWRLDFARGFSGVYVKEYIEVTNPAFAIGEYWDSLAYEGGNLCYNQDAHRQRIVNWINATGGTSSAFDVTTKGILHSALHNQYWRLIDPQGKPTGVMGWWPSRAVTFLENHDTGSTQGHWPFPRDKLLQGYAYILTHSGTPTVFYDHFYDFGIRDNINELIEARKRAGIHCRSSVKICHANNEGYVAKVDESLVMKIGGFDWNPSKEHSLDGIWQKFIDKGHDYQIWLRQ